MKGVICLKSNTINGVFSLDNPENVCISASAGSRRYNTTTSFLGGGHTHHEVLLILYCGINIVSYCVQNVLILSARNMIRST